MATAKSKKPLTTRDNLSALIASARKILRKDKGLNGDVDRLPLLTWVMFLKFLDDLEFKHEQEAALDGKRYQPIIEKPYRWRDWATREDGITGDELLAFIGQEYTHRADGSLGQGLFAYLRALAGEGEKGSQREVIANVFKGVQNRMVSGYLLRDIVNKINGIHVNASEEIHTLSHLYESMLREMRDAAGDSGEFYTPRPVVRFMVQVTNPQLGDTVLDPACGTGGFLVEAFDHLGLQHHRRGRRAGGGVGVELEARFQVEAAAHGVVLGPQFADPAPRMAADPVTGHAGGGDQAQFVPALAQNSLAQPRAEGGFAELAFQRRTGLRPDGRRLRIDNRIRNAPSSHHPNLFCRHPSKRPRTRRTLFNKHKALSGERNAPAAASIIRNQMEGRL